MYMSWLLMENEINYSPRQLLECQVSSAGEELCYSQQKWTQNHEWPNCIHTRINVHLFIQILTVTNERSSPPSRIFSVMSVYLFLFLLMYCIYLIWNLDKCVFFPDSSILQHQAQRVFTESSQSFQNPRTSNFIILNVQLSDLSK